MEAKFKNVIVIAAAFLLGFSSCSKDNEFDDGGDTGKLKSVFLKISSENAVTYSESSPGTNSPVEFGVGNLYFVNGFGDIVKHYTLSNGITNNNNIELSSITGAKGATISNLPASVTGVYIVGNYIAGGMPSSGNISLVQSIVLNVSSQRNFALVNLYGSSQLTPAAGGDKYECTVTLKPTVARIELEDINAGDRIKSFKVSGVFVDSYYSQAAMNGDLNIANWVPSSSVASDFIKGSTKYNGFEYAVYDFYDTALSSNISKKVVPSSDGKVWGYNLFTSDVSSPVPHIVIRLTNVETVDGKTYPDPQFITIKGFKNNGTSLTGIQAGNIYRIGAGKLVFTEDDLTPIPNKKTIDVAVTVKLANWSIIDVEPEL